MTDWKNSKSTAKLTDASSVKALTDSLQQVKALLQQQISKDTADIEALRVKLAMLKSGGVS